ncbi:MAG: 4-alpha-glucanotransferase [Clostridiales bacterium]|nr:4-alpha-glucanotransferase [Clostridiales bacterium]
MMRNAGILMPIFSLPSPYGIGTLGQSARDFIDFLKEAGQTYWQILPICPTGYGDSPYQSFSAYAGNPYLIDLDDLAEEGLLSLSSYQNINWGDDPICINYERLYQQRFFVLKEACKMAKQRFPDALSTFFQEESAWLEDYALFMTLKSHFDGKAWLEWPETFRKRENEALSSIILEPNEEIQFWKTVQFLFFHQRKQLKAYANEQGISIIGDLPFYVSGDSADVWSHPEQFQLDEHLNPTEIAGCPPDGFSADGQLWGNPLYNWDAMREDGYRWWIRRISYQKKIYDIIRIDHFRGFESYYAIPYGDTTAARGRWRPGPGIDFFRKTEQSLGKLDIIAEDLGFLTKAVKQLLTDSGFPGMKVLEFAFDSRDTGSGYLPHCYTHNCIAYTGTHDNETILGWMETAPREDVEKAIRYLRLTKEEGYHWGMMRSIWGSVAKTAIVQMPDLLGLGHEGRINTPSTLGNWTWRCQPDDFNQELAQQLYEEMRLYERLPE